MLAVAADGFHAAFSRHEELRTTSDPIQLFVPTAECAYWAAALDEQLWEWSGYEGARARSQGGLLLPGLRYIRNLKTHGLPMTLRKIDGAMFPVVFPKVFSEVVWLPLEELPAPGKLHRRTEEQRNIYREHLAGRPTRHTLQAVKDFLILLKTLPDSPLAN